MLFVDAPFFDACHYLWYCGAKAMDNPLNKDGDGIFCAIAVFAYRVRPFCSIFLEYPHVVHLHLLWEYGGIVWAARPVAAHDDIE